MLAPSLLAFSYTVGNHLDGILPQQSGSSYIDVNQNKKCVYTSSIIETRQAVFMNLEYVCMYVKTMKGKVMNWKERRRQSCKGAAGGKEGEG